MLRLQQMFDMMPLCVDVGLKSLPPLIDGLISQPDAPLIHPGWRQLFSLIWLYCLKLIEVHTLCAAVVDTVESF